MLDALHNAIEAVAPIDGVSVGRRDDKSTWKIVFKAEATDAQKAAAATVLASFDAVSLRRADLLKRVDHDAEVERAKHLTPGVGMALTYQEKFAQAQAVAAMGRDAANALSATDREAQFPTLSASVGIEAPTLADAADLVLTRYGQFAQLSLRIERVRLAGKAAIKAATTAADCDAAYRAITWTLR